MNERLFDALNGLAGHSAALDAAARWLANDAIFLLAAALLAFGALELRRDLRRGARIGLAGCLALALAGLLILAASSAVHEARPFVGDADTVLLTPHVADNGFPSDHATVAAAAAVVAAIAWRRWAALFLALAAVVGLARVLAGVHLPGDVLAGWALGAAAAAAGWWLAERASSRVEWLRGGLVSRV
jgi:undecaprenyl-diphosphatase